jgi:hypothetical protein
VGTNVSEEHTASIFRADTLPIMNILIFGYNLQFKFLFAGVARNDGAYERNSVH